MIVLRRGNFTVNTVGNGLQEYRSEPRRERMASESSGESGVSSDAGADLAQAVGRRLASPDCVTQTA